MMLACDHNVTPEESRQVSRERVEDTEMPLPNLTNDHHEPSKTQSETSEEAPPSLPMEGVWYEEKARHDAGYVAKKS